MFHHVIHGVPVFLVIYLFVHYFNCYFIRTNGLRIIGFCFFSFLFLSEISFHNNFYLKNAPLLNPTYHSYSDPLVNLREPNSSSKKFRLILLHICAVLLIHAMLAKNCTVYKLANFPLRTSLRVNFQTWNRSS